MDHIDEFQSPNFHGVAQKCFAVLLMLTLVAVAAKSRQASTVQPIGVRSSEVLIVLFAVYSGLYASRNIPVSALLLILVIGPRLSNALETFSATLSKRSIDSRPLAQHPLISPAHASHRIQPLRPHLADHWQSCSPAGSLSTAGKLGTKPLMNAPLRYEAFPGRRSKLPRNAM